MLTIQHASTLRSLLRDSFSYGFFFCFLSGFVQNTPKERQVSSMREFVKISYHITRPLSSLSNHEESCRDGVIDCAAWWAIISRYGHMHGESPQYSALPSPPVPLIKPALHYLHWELTEWPGPYLQWPRGPDINHQLRRKKLASEQSPHNL